MKNVITGAVCFAAGLGAGILLAGSGLLDMFLYGRCDDKEYGGSDPSDWEDPTEPEE